MRRFFEWTVGHRKLMLVLFAVLFVVCLVLQNTVSVNYAMDEYLPAGTHSTVSLEVMREEFASGIPNARVMVRGVSIPEALEYKERLAEVDGVTSVMWLDDAADIAVPLSTMDRGTLESYYKDGDALFTVTIADAREIEAVEVIREVIGDSNAVTGAAVSIADAMSGSAAEIRIITVIAVLFVLAVLTVTTRSWAEPVLVLIGIGVAVIINNGTHAIFGEVSFATNAAGSVLQLAVSLDYSVFLIHRFEECRAGGKDAESAMTDALCKSASSILSSGLTTVIGFLALVLMQFGLGPDLGIALAKGIAISLITVFLFMPALILACYKLMDRTRHRSFLPSFKGFGRFIRRAAIPMVCIFVLLIVPSYLASNANDFLYGSSKMFSDDSRYTRDTEAIDDIFGRNDTFVLLVPKGDTAKQTELSAALKELPYMNSIVSYVDMAGAEIPPEFLDEATLGQLESEHYSRMVLAVGVPVESEETFALVQQIRDTAQEFYPDEYYLVGNGVSTYDLKQTVTSDMFKVNTVAIAAVFVVLLLMMRSIALPVILVVCIETAIWINLAVPYFAGSQLFYIAYLIISSMQLGATVDYAILFTDRYRENRAELDKREAVVMTVSNTLASILTSGSVLTVAGFLLGIFSSNRLIAQLGVLIGRGAIFSLVIVLFVLPGILMLFDRFIIRKKHKKSREATVK